MILFTVGKPTSTSAFLQWLMLSVWRNCRPTPYKHIQVLHFKKLGGFFIKHTLAIGQTHCYTTYVVDNCSTVACTADINAEI